MQFIPKKSCHKGLHFCRACEECSQSDNFPEETLEEAENYCRNPTNDAEGEFCFTVANNEKVFCDIPDCNQGRGPPRPPIL